MELTKRELLMILGTILDDDEGLNIENFDLMSIHIETIFQNCKNLGIDVYDIEEEYNFELIQAGGMICENRLIYIKSHVRNLISRIISFKE